MQTQSLPIPGRVSMGMMTLLTLASMFGSLSAVVPAISYSTKLDVWMVIHAPFACDDDQVILMLVFVSPGRLHRVRVCHLVRVHCGSVHALLPCGPTEDQHCSKDGQNIE